ncbi:MAG: HEAT repeat domain-containing protein [Cyanobacteria bacterium P01_H01_bin.15]
MSTPPPTLAEIEQQLQSSEQKDRILALLALQAESTPALTAFPLLKRTLSDESVQVRGMAAFALGIKPTDENWALLVEVMTTDPDYNVRAIAAGALGYLEDKRAFEALRHAFYEDSYWLVPFSAAVALGNLKDPRAQTVLLEALESSETLYQQAAVMALGEIGAVETLDRLLPFVNSPDWLMRKQLAEALANLPDPRSEAALDYLRKDDNAQVAEAATRSRQKLREVSQTID